MSVGRFAVRLLAQALVFLVLAIALGWLFWIYYGPQIVRIG